MIGNTKYAPGMYAQKKLGTPERVDIYFREWEKRRLRIKKEKLPLERPPTICFSRKIGVGAVEVADILAEKIDYRVVDREVLEYIAKKSKIREKTLAIFDELYPGKLDDFWSMLAGEKSFIQRDYTRHLFKAVLSIAHLGPTIFVGRGTHLILPRERVLAVRMISGRQHRIERIAGTLKISEQEADGKLDQIDKEQRNFFKKVFGKKDASPYEFDLVINFDYITAPQWAADIVATAFSKKFGKKIKLESFLPRGNANTQIT